MTTRPVPQRIAGYNPAAPREIGRVPLSPTSTGPDGYPPVSPIFASPPFFSPPPITIPVVIPPGQPPCDDIPDNDIPDCDSENPEPPTDVPEPGMLILMMTGGLIYLLFEIRARQPVRVRK